MPGPGGQSGAVSATRPGRRALAAGTALLLLVLTATYLLSAFSVQRVTATVQVGLVAVILVLALRTSPLPGRWPMLIGVVTMAGSVAAALGASVARLVAAYRSPAEPKNEPRNPPPSRFPPVRRPERHQEDQWHDPTGKHQTVPAPAACFTAAVSMDRRQGRSCGAGPTGAGVSRSAGGVSAWGDGASLAEAT